MIPTGPSRAGAPLPDPDVPEPGILAPRDQLTWQFVRQARACGIMGSPMYEHLLRHAAADIVAGGACWSLVRDHVAPGRGNAIALRLMAGVHRLVLTGRSSELARHYPSAGGHFDPETTAGVFLATVEQFQEELAELVALPCQTNESGRAAALLVGLLTVAREARLPIALREIGTAAGLNLRLDHFRYGGSGQAWGPTDSPVDLRGHWTDIPAVDDVNLQITSRRGVDRSPIDPTTDDGELALSSSIWGDQVQRFQRLSGAIELARRIPVQIETGDAAQWVAETFTPVAGQATVLMQSVVDEYLAPAKRERLRESVHDAGRRATPEAPVAWLRLEPISAVRRHGLTVSIWPGEAEHLLVTSAALGADVRRPTSTEV